MRRIFGKAILLAAALMFSIAGTSCSSSGDNVNSLPENNGNNGNSGNNGNNGSSGENPSTPDDTPDNKQDESTFAKGADVSWLTEMEKDGKKFYNANGTEQECLALLKDNGVNSIRLRVWVDPDGGWCGKDDVVAKAERAQKLGMRIMIDFHYSDIWADPSRQAVPAAWENYSFEEMKQAVSDHTKDVLNALKAKSIDVEWVQVGNETCDGMLWGKNTGTVNDPKWGGETDKVSGRASKSPKNYAAYELAGYEAVKAVYPNAKVVVHIDKGQELGRFTWIFNILKNNGGKWDVIGMSLYPEDKDWKTTPSDCLSNIKTLSSMYNCNVVISEIGMQWNSSNAATMMSTMVTGCKAISTCEGIFYWEPEVYNSWKPANYTTLGWGAYTKGAFDNSGKPTAVFDAYK